MSMDVREAPDATSQPAVGLGAWLRERREAAGLSVEEVARALKLSGSTVQDLERDRTEHIGAPIYYKGFVRAYGKLLALPAQALEERLSALVDHDPEPQIAQGTAPIRRNRWLERYTLAASYVVGTALLLPLLYWLLSGDGRELPQDLLQTPVSQGTESSVATDASQPTQPPPIVAPEIQAADSPVYPAPVAASLTPFGLGRGALPQTSASNGLVELRLSAPSWVAIEDAGGERLVYRTLPAGEHVIDGGQWPLRLRIGNASRAQLFIDGQALALEAHVRGNVATLALQREGERIEAASLQP